VKGNAVFAVVQFEYTTRDQKQAPCTAAAVADRRADAGPGPVHRQAVAGEVPQRRYLPVNGLWITCGASLSPWNTHLSSEEYEPDASAIASNRSSRPSARTCTATRPTANPYHYGHLPEVTVNPDGTGSIKKHYCLGRISHELVQVMPDQRTA
jgi:hypothetical protein